MDATTVAALVLIALLMARPAEAYIDPGSGSMLVQLVTGGVAGGLVLARLYWKRLKEKVTGRSSTTTEAHSAAPETKDRM